MRLIASSAVASAALGLAVAGCGGGGDTSVATVTPNHVSEVKGCKAVPPATPTPVTEGAPKPLLKKGQKATAVVKTSCGSFTIALDTEQAPVTANAFANLAEDGVYDGTDFHRVVKDFVIQAGSEEFTGPKGQGFTATETPPKNVSYRRGAVAMAKAAIDPIGASTGEFFVVTAPAQASLQPVFAPIGRVTDGLDTVERIASLANPALGSDGGPPIQPVVIDSVTIH
jgi:peptidyl-prolyl cis-trans isomerase B (cyclophilin B)